MDGKQRYGCCAVDKLDELVPSHVKPTFLDTIIVQARTAAQEEAVSGRPMPARVTSALHLKADTSRTSRHLRFVPCVDIE